MRVQRETRVDERIGVQDEGTFRIKTSPELFSLLSDGLYTDKILAVVRELSCNAWDAQKEAGNEDEPFEIHLPNALEPFFSIRDYGTGLSHKDVLTLYTTYGDSTKNNSNDFIGALGVGSKSPFAYGDSFTITSFFEGERRSYTAFLSAEGIPSIAMMGDPVKTEARNGLDISLPVNTKDFHDFKVKAVQVLKRFDPVPHVLAGTEKFEIPSVKYTLEGNGWKLRDESHNQWGKNAMAIQGKIAYPIDYEAMGSSYSATALEIFSLPVDIDFAIGDLDIAASREGLGYKPRTIQNLVARAEEIYEEIKEMVSEKVSNAKNLWEARIIHSELSSGSNPIGRLGISPMYRGKSAFHTVELEMKDFPSLSVCRPTLNYRYNLVKDAFQHRLSLRASNDIVFYVDDIGRGIWPRTKFALTEANHGRGPFNGKTVYILRPGDDVDTFNKSLREFSKYLGGAKVLKLSTIPMAPKKEREKRADILVRDLTASSRNDRESWEDTEIDLTHGGFYVEVNNYRTMDKKGYRFNENFDRYGRVEHTTRGKNLNLLVRELVKLGFMKETDKVYGIRSRNLDFVRKNPKWINVFDLAEEKFLKLVKTKKVDVILANQTELENLQLPSWFSRISIDDLEKVTNPTFKKFVDLYLSTKKQSVSVDGFEQLQQLMKVLDLEIKPAKLKDSLANLWKEVATQAPLLMFLNFNYGRPEDRHINALIHYLDNIS